jgi:hypothetical protein
MAYRVVKAVAVVALLVGSSPRPERACEHFCSCRRPDPRVSGAAIAQAKRDAAERVAFGAVVRIDTLPRVSWGAGHDAVTLSPIVARVAVRQVWRGAVRDTMTVMFQTLESRWSCELTLRVGTSYVIFARRTEGGPLGTGACTGTAEAKDAAATLAALGAGEIPKR